MHPVPAGVQHLWFVQLQVCIPFTLSIQQCQPLSNSTSAFSRTALHAELPPKSRTTASKPVPETPHRCFVPCLCLLKCGWCAPHTSLPDSQAAQAAGAYSMYLSQAGLLTHQVIETHHNAIERGCHAWVT